MKKGTKKMKAILISIQSPHVCNILNLIKLWEIRKKFPSDYVGWVYIYVTKGNKHECLEYADNPNPNKEGKWVITSGYPYANGKVVARFWCDKVEIVRCNSYVGTSEYWYRTKEMHEKELLEKSCLSFNELDEYLEFDNGFAIHITKLEIFDRPKEISEFYKVGYRKIVNTPNRIRNKNYLDEYLMAVKEYQLTRAPQSWCWIEV